MQEHQKRVLDEEQELNDKLMKLTSFIGTDFFNSLDEENKKLLRDQEKAMAEYSSILAKRIELF